jgi:predicted MPP superfamily phosphohydrolase
MRKPDLTRRQFLSGLVATPLIALAATSAYASLIEPHNYEVTETDIFIRNLPERFVGFRITQLTDLHHSRIVGIGQVRRVVELAQETRPIYSF